MNSKITRAILEAHLRCKYKGYLRLAGEQGTVTDYEAMLTERRDEARLSAIDRIAACVEDKALLRNVALDLATLKAGPSFVLDTTYEEQLVCLHFDGVKKVAGPSLLGDFHYVPMLFHGGHHVRKEQKVLLELFALFLLRIQGVVPSGGIVWLGRDARPTRVRLDTGLEKARHALQEITRMHASEGKPKLVLNDHCQVCEFRQRCRLQAVQDDSLSLLRGLGEKEMRGLARKGILTLTQLAHTFRPRRKGKRQQRKAGRHFHALKALAIRDKKIYVFGTPQLPEGPVHVYLDIEGVPDEGFVYLIGLTVLTGKAEEQLSIWADRKEQEKDIFEQFLDVLSRHDDFLVFCYGGYEKAFLKRMRERTERKELADKVLASLVNVLSVVYSHIYFPCYSNGLKEVAGHLGCTWTEPDSSGIQSLVWRARWQTTGDDTWKHKLLAYNAEDCVALRRVTDLVRAIAHRSVAAQDSPASGEETPPLVFVADLDKQAQDRKWGPAKFVHADYRFVNECAYFDYQRDRVYIRSSKSIRRSMPKRGKHQNRKLRVSLDVTVLSTNCPFCGSGGLTLVAAHEQVECPKPRVKRAFDLVITSAGIRRRVIQCRARVQRCLSCGKSFVPEQHRRLDKHFHGLKSWAMYQHIAHRSSMGTIQTLFEEFFGLRVWEEEIHMFKSLMASYYGSTYKQLLARILEGGLVHVDETEVTLRSGKGYVWVFTNLEEVVFMYRPTREGDFLKPLLKDFRGVLVSDFYAAYDSIECAQQKCLIHLMRDINQDLLNNPYDEELQSIARPFGSLLRAIVTTVDEHGLKRRHLKKHERDVERFFESLSGPAFLSDVAEALRKRLIKHRDKLFTFILHDDVPWNNNNAENAIKRFAYYREDTVGLLKEQGLSDYLVLLSICHTCRYKGISFLKFLLSRELDLDVFIESRRRKKEPVTLELYPDGFIPPHLVKVRQSRQPQKALEIATGGASASTTPPIPGAAGGKGPFPPEQRTTAKP